MKIIWWDIDHVLMESETRPPMAHSLEKLENGMWHCTCEDAVITGNECCKHIAQVKQIEETAKMWRGLSNEQATNRENQSIKEGHASQIEFADHTG